MIELQGRIGGRHSITAQIGASRKPVGGQIAPGGTLSGQVARNRSLVGSISAAGALSGQLTDKHGPQPGEIVFGPLMFVDSAILPDAPPIIYQEGELT